MKSKLTIATALLSLLISVITVYAVESSKPSSHDISWLQRHGTASKANLGECVQCHTDQVTCTQCHQEVSPRSHTPVWLKTGHGTEARWDRAKCATCHKEDSCTDCHQNTRPSSHRPGWSGNGTVQGSRHCVNCHYPLQDTTCAMCHKTGHLPNTYKK
jgi:hypothetical protein